MSNSWDSLAHFLQEKPITYVIKSDMNFKDFILYQNLSVFLDTLYKTEYCIAELNLNEKFNLFES